MENKNKLPYSEPLMEVEKLKTADVILTSNVFTQDGDSEGWT
jgi:hypothetical protein